MHGRTFFRILIENLFLKNALAEAFKKFLNFYYEQRYYNERELKFIDKLPLNNIQVQSKKYDSRFVFNVGTKNGV